MTYPTTEENTQEQGKIYPRARKPWASVELVRLRKLLPYKYTREELVNFFGRSPANLAATIRDFKSVLKEMPVADKESIMFRPELPSFGAYDFNAKFEELFPTLSEQAPTPVPMVSVSNEEIKALLEYPAPLKAVKG